MKADGEPYTVVGENLGETTVGKLSSFCQEQRLGLFIEHIRQGDATLWFLDSYEPVSIWINPSILRCFPLHFKREIIIFTNFIKIGMDNINIFFYGRGQGINIILEFFFLAVL